MKSRGHVPHKCGPLAQYRSPLEFSLKQVMDKEGARLTAYSFTSPSGGVFSYTVENDSEPGGGIEEMEAWEADDAMGHLWDKASRRQVMQVVRALAKKLLLDLSPLSDSGIRRGTCRRVCLVDRAEIVRGGEWMQSSIHPEVSRIRPSRRVIGLVGGLRGLIGKAGVITPYPHVILNAAHECLLVFIDECSERMHTNEPRAAYCRGLEKIAEFPSPSSEDQGREGAESKAIS